MDNNQVNSLFKTLSVEAWPIETAQSNVNYYLSRYTGRDGSATLRVSTVFSNGNKQVHFNWEFGHDTQTLLVYNSGGYTRICIFYFSYDDIWPSVAKRFSHFSYEGGKNVGDVFVEMLEERELISNSTILLNHLK